MSSASREHVNQLARHEIVRAGAGAGKTYTLTHKVMDLAEEHFRVAKQFPRIVVTTFTRKATQELRERLMVLALDEKPHLVDFVNSRSHLVVSTMHGVMDMYLKRYGANVCIDPGYKIVGGIESLKLARQALRETLLSDEEGSKADLLEAFPFNRLVGLVRRLDLLEFESPNALPFKLEDFEKIFITRASRAADDLEEAAARVLEETDKDSWVEMAKGFVGMAKMLRATSALDWQKKRELFISLRENLTIARRSGKGIPPVCEETIEFAKQARERADEFREPLYDPQAWHLFADRYQVLVAVAQDFSTRFRKAKREAGQLEISDLEAIAMDCIRKHPQTAEAFWQEWDHWLIDEYQDTSPFQVELLRHLSGESPNFIVGDPQQSIYLFRGARSEVFAEKEKEILGSGGTRRLLTVNRRSRPELLLFFNDFFSRFTPPFQPMEPFLEEDEAIDSSRVVAKIQICSEPAEDESPKDGDSPEMKALVAEVQELLAQGSRPEDICILARTNSVLSEVAEHLAQAHLPIHVHAASGFYDRREIQDALVLLKFIANPHDNANTIELLRSPWFRVPDDIIISHARPRPPSVWESIAAEKSMSDQFEAVLRLSRVLENSLAMGLTESFRSAMIDAGLFDLCHVHDVSGRRESNLWKLIARLQVEECRAGFNPVAFVTGSRAELKLEEGNAEGDAVAAVEPDRINLMTVHASKGLEFKHVLIPRLEQRPRLTTSEAFTYDERSKRWALRVPFGDDGEMTQSLPEADWLEIFREQEIREHARVLYVALTRAIETVYLSWTGQPANESWASMVKLELSPGVHKAASYSYSVSTDAREPLAAAKAKSESQEPRALWRQDVVDSGKASSVTEIMDRAQGRHVKSGSEKDISKVLTLASRGTAVHRLMELLKYPSQDRLARLVKKWFPGKEEEVLEAVEFVRECSAPPLLEVIKNGEVEWGFAFTLEGGLIEGQVDLWGQTEAGEYWIVDYKTGNPEFREKAFDQMALYALALRKSGLVPQEKPIQLAAVFPFAREIFVAPEAPLEKVLKILGRA